MNQDNKNSHNFETQKTDIGRKGAGLNQQGYGADNQNAGRTETESDAGMRNVRQQDRANLKQDYEEPAVDEESDSSLSANRSGNEQFDRDKSMY